MIRRTEDFSRLKKMLEPVGDVFAGKLRALLEAYGTSYPFCTFYIKDNILIGSYYGAACLCTVGGGALKKDEELSGFLRFNFGEALMPYKLYETALGKDPAFIAETEYVMRLRCNKSAASLSEIDNDVKAEEISLGEAYEIIRDGFDIDYDTWYTDTSHNVRHGVSRVFGGQKSVCAVRVFSYDAISFYSYVAVKRERRGLGLAAGLFKSLAEEEGQRGNDIYVICPFRLKTFYEKLGFSEISRCTTINI